MEPALRLGARALETGEEKEKGIIRIVNAEPVEEPGAERGHARYSKKHSVVGFVYPGPGEAVASEEYYEGDACPEHTHVIKKTHEERISELEQAVQELRELRS